jgi:hypothetical protein
MRKHNQFLANQIARFGAMSIPQMQLACSGRCGRATIYRMLDDLLKMELIKRMPHSGEGKFLFSPRHTLNRQVYGEDMKRNTGINEINILHAAAVTETLLTLSRYSFVTGIATEFEMSPDDVGKFCYSRTPDGIIQITNESGTFELAIEVESSRKTHARIAEVIEKYRNTFLKNMPCAGLIVVVNSKSLFDAFQSKIAELPSEIENRYLVVMQEGLSTLNQKYFGEFKNVPQGSLEKIATFTQGSPKFYPMITGDSFLKSDPIVPDHSRQSAKSAEAIG